MWLGSLIHLWKIESAKHDSDFYWLCSIIEKEDPHYSFVGLLFSNPQVRTTPYNFPATILENIVSSETARKRCSNKKMLCN